LKYWSPYVFIGITLSTTALAVESTSPEVTASGDTILAQLSGVGTEPAVLDQNRALKIISVREEQDGTIVVAYQALKRLDWLGTAYPGGLRELADVMVDFYDAQGALIRTARYPARMTPSGVDVMSPGEIGIRKVTKPLNARSYRVWLVK